MLLGGGGEKLCVPIATERALDLAVCLICLGFPGGASGEESACQCRRLPMQEMQVQSLGQEDPLEKKTATQSSILA